MVILSVEDNGHPESIAQRDNGAECSWVVTNNQGWLESCPMTQKSEYPRQNARFRWSNISAALRTNRERKYRHLCWVGDPPTSW